MTGSQDKGKQFAITLCTTRFKGWNVAN